MKKKLITDCGVIGAGFAGITTALELADAGFSVNIFIKNKLDEDCNSYLTAGGLTAVPSINNIPLKGDSFKKHIQDTLEAGKHLNNKNIVEFCSKNFYPKVIQWLIKKGIKFDKAHNSDFKYDLHREGGHSANRIFHAGDTTGKEIINKLRKLVKKHPNIKIHENHMAIDLITKNKILNKRPRGESKPTSKDECLGFYVYDIDNNYVKTVSCKGTFIATGGLGKVFLYTSNPDIASGDGFAMCYREGIELANMEFIQFHPSVFYDEKADTKQRRFLLTEALRGAGAFLKLNKHSKKDFVLKYHKQGSKATRDVVTRAEDLEMRKNNLKHVWLDCTKISKKSLKNDFINSYKFCLQKGIDITKQPIPVVYAVHYSNGGVLVNKKSSTNIQNCYVIGETSYTGLHGATRLASNSAPECILFGRLAAKDFSENIKKVKTNQKSKIKIPLWKTGKAVEIKDKTTIEYYWETIRKTTTSLCGIARNKSRLTAAKEVLQALKKDINRFYWKYYVNKDFLEVRNIIDVALIVIESALAREESRACHFREDFPYQKSKFKGVTVIKNNKKPKIKKSKK